MPPRKKSSKSKATTQARPATSAEVAELRRELAEVRAHRDLLIQALHGLATRSTATRSLAAVAAKPDPEAVYAWVAEEIEQLTPSLPVIPNETLGALNVPIPQLVQAINQRWFPSGGGFHDLPASTTLGNLALAIWQNL
jgi:hypothetical protein